MRVQALSPAGKRMGKVHELRPLDYWHAVCGRLFRPPPAERTTKPVTCQRCLKAARDRELEPDDERDYALLKAKPEPQFRTL